jgi:hypothetical protein
LKGFETAINSDETAENPTPRHFYVAYSSQHAVLGTTRNVVQLTVDNLAKGGKLPEIVTKESHKTLATGFLNSAESYATGFIDIEKLVQLAKSSAKDASSNNLDNIPLRAGAISSWMKSAPGTDASFLLWPKNDEQKKLLSALGSTTSEQLLAIVPESPMLFLSVAGSIFKLGENMAENPQGGEDSPLALLKDIRRTVIAAKPAAVGQSLLPVPEILIGIEASNSGKIGSTLAMLVQSSLPPSPAGGPEEADKAINGVQVKQIVTPLGVSIFVGTVDPLVLVTTSEAQMTSAIASLKSRKSAFIQKLSPDQRASLVETPNAAALHLDFPQVATFVESISSLLQMYGAGGPDSKSAFGTPEQVEAIRKRGTLTGAARVNGEVLEVKSFYSPSV